MSRYMENNGTRLLTTVREESYKYAKREKESESCGVNWSWRYYEFMTFNIYSYRNVYRHERARERGRVYFLTVH